jgi:hypothetical protein
MDKKHLLRNVDKESLLKLKDSKPVSITAHSHEIIIPCAYTSVVGKFLDKKGIKLPLDPHDLAEMKRIAKKTPGSIKDYETEEEKSRSHAKGTTNLQAVRQNQKVIVNVHPPARKLRVKRRRPVAKPLVSGAIPMSAGNRHPGVANMFNSLPPSNYNLIRAFSGINNNPFVEASKVPIPASNPMNPPSNALGALAGGIGGANTDALVRRFEESQAKTLKEYEEKREKEYEARRIRDEELFQQKIDLNKNRIKPVEQPIKNSSDYEDYDFDVVYEPEQGSPVLESKEDEVEEPPPIALPAAGNAPTEPEGQAEPEGPPPKLKSDGIPIDDVPVEKRVKNYNIPGLTLTNAYWRIGDKGQPDGTPIQYLRLAYGVPEEGGAKGEMVVYTVDNKGKHKAFSLLKKQKKLPDVKRLMQEYP